MTVTTQIDYTEIRDKRVRGEICELMSAMLDNPDEYGIFPTSEFMWKVETFILGETKRFRDAMEEIIITQPIACDGKPQGDYACDLHKTIAEEALNKEQK